MRRAAATRCIVSSQNIHGNRDATARALGVPPADVRFIAPDVGGGFGAKNFTYAEHALILWAAKRVGRPVKWIATRSEGFVSDHQARDHQAEASLALDADGKFLALRVSSVANIGAYMAGGAGAVQTNQYVHLQGSIYAIPAIALHVVTVLSNTTPIGVTRGPGFAEAVNIIERLIDAAARQCGFDRAELRRRNMVPAAAMPMTNALGFSVDSGNFAQTFDRALEAADVAGFAARRAESEARGLLRGLGFAYHIKGTGGSPHENVDIRFEADGTVSLITGTQTIGQGHETTFPQILADRLGIPNASHPAVPGRYRPDPDGRRPWQFARDLHGRHRDLARVGDDRARRAGRSPPMRWRQRKPTSSSPTDTSLSSAPIARSRCWTWPRGRARLARRSTPTTRGRAST